MRNEAQFTLVKFEQLQCPLFYFEQSCVADGHGGGSAMRRQVFIATVIAFHHSISF